MCKESGARKPLIHCITNPIAMNQSANAILALGARPIMAEHPMEVEEITETADALLLNFGNISDIRMTAMKKAIEVANTKGIPVVVDVVGIACSELRRNFFYNLIEKVGVDVIKGNYSEIYTLFNRDYRSSGVDAGIDVTEDMVGNALLYLSEKYHCIVLATGAEDLIAAEGVIRKVEGGCAQMSLVTGTGCMLGSIIASLLAFNNSVDSVEKACSFFKQCGEKAKTDKGTGTFMVNLMDAIGDWNGF